MSIRRAHCTRDREQLEAPGPRGGLQIDPSRFYLQISFLFNSLVRKACIQTVNIKKKGPSCRLAAELVCANDYAAVHTMLSSCIHVPAVKTAGRLFLSWKTSRLCTASEFEGEVMAGFELCTICGGVVAMVTPVSLQLRRMSATSVQGFYRMNIRTWVVGEA